MKLAILVLLSLPFVLIGQAVGFIVYALVVGFAAGVAEINWITEEATKAKAKTWVMDELAKQEKGGGK